MTQYFEGPVNAPLVLVGEAPGAEEERAGRPFVGAAGQLLTELLGSAGIQRSSCYFDTVIQHRPKGGNISQLIKITGTKVVETEDYRKQRALLLTRLAATSAHIIVTMGNVPTYALTGKLPITKQRGSLLHCPELPEKKILACIHPSAALREYLFRYHIVNDLLRARDQMDSPETGLLERNFILTPSYTEALEYLNLCQQQPEVAYDIETRGQELSHISFCFDPASAICIPFVQGAESYWSPDQEAQIMYCIAELMADETVTKIGQNLTFDATFLYSKFGIYASPLQDTMIAQGILYPDFPKGLDFLTSIYCEGEPYYKDDGKEWFKNPFGSEDVFRRYNAMDSAVLMQIWPAQKEELKQQGNYDSYNRQKALLHPLVYAGNKGIRVETSKMQTAAAASQARIDALQLELNSLAGCELNPNSSKQLQHYFYIVKRLRAHIRQGKVSVDDKALKQIAAKGHAEAELILQLRHEKKMLSTYYNMTLDPDNRMRCSFNPVGTAQGRISSSKTIRGTGGNQQNQPPEMNALMLADPGYILINQDLAQAENRVVAYVNGEDRMIDAFEQGIDIHKQTASLIFKVPIEEVTYDQRSDGKKANHGLNYDLGFRSFSVIYQMPSDRAKLLVDAYHRVYPGVREGHAALRYELAQNNRTLTNCFGRRRNFKERWGHELFKVAYSYIPQSTVAGLMNQAGVVFLYSRQDLFPEVEFLNTIHDSIRYQIPLSAGLPRIISIVTAIKDSLETPIQWKGRSFSIPTDTEVGFSFDKDTMLEWKAKHFDTAGAEGLVEELKIYVQNHGELG